MKGLHLLVVGLLVACVACGGDDQSTPATDATATTSATTEAAGASDTVATTEATTTTTTTTVPEPTEPLAVWFSETRAGRVISIDPVTLEVLTETETGSGSESFGFGAGSAWVVGNEAGEVYRVDAETGELLATIPADANTAGIVFSDGYAFAANFGTGPDFPATVVAIDPTSNEVVETFDVGSGATGMTQGSAVGVTFRSGEIYRIDGDLMLERSTIADGLSEVTATADHYFVTAPSEGLVHKVDRTTLELVESTSVGSTPNFITFDGTEIWISDSSGGILRMDPATLAASPAVDIPSPMGIDAVTLDGTTWVFVGTWSGGVYRFDAADPAGSLTPAYMGSNSIFGLAVSGV